jgi:site-specific DNA recombinase
MPKKQAVSIQENAIVVGYTRVSTAEQADSGLSMAAQRARIEAYCQAREFKLVAIEEDAGESGSIQPSRRSGLTRALQHLEQGRAQGLIVLRLDRLSRSVMDTLRVADLFKRRDWQLVSVAENLETHTPSGRLFLTILAAMNEHERSLIADRTQAALVRVARDGRPRSRIVPFGHRLKGLPEILEVPKGTAAKLIEHHGEQVVLRRILRHRREGLGPRRIAKKLNAAGIHNPRTHKPWSPSLIQRLLATSDRRAYALAD